MKRVLLACTFVFSGVAQAAESSAYFGALFGMTTVDVDITQTVNTTVDDKDSGFQGIIGFSLSDNVSLEGHYADLGEATITMQNGGSYVADGQTVTNNNGSVLTINATGDTIGVGMVLHGDKSDDFVPFVKAGFHSWDSEATGSAAGENVSLTDDGNDPFFGAGFMYGITDSVSIRGEYTIFKFDSESISFAGAGLVVGF